MRSYNIAAFLMSATVATGVWADDLSAPKGDVLLTVSGILDTTNAGETAQLDLEMLKQMETTKFETTTIWTDGVHTFEGVELAELVEELGIGGDTLFASAINDYTVEIPIDDAAEDGPIVAYRMDGKEMSVRDKGPLWIIYPYDENTDYQSEVVYSRSIWQLDRIESR